MCGCPAPAWYSEGPGFHLLSPLPLAAERNIQEKGEGKLRPRDAAVPCSGVAWIPGTPDQLLSRGMGRRQSLPPDPPQESESLVAGQSVQSTALGQAVQLKDGDVQAEEEVHRGPRQTQTQVQELLAMVETQELPGRVEGQPLGQAEAQWLVDLPLEAEPWPQCDCCPAPSLRPPCPQRPPHPCSRLLWVLSPTRMAQRSIFLRKAVESRCLVFRLSSIRSHTHGMPQNVVGWTSWSISVRKPWMGQDGALGDPHAHKGHEVRSFSMGARMGQGQGR